MKKYFAEVNDGEEYVYELKSVVIHSGSCSGGHYHAYIRDGEEQGNWHLQKLEGFAEGPGEMEAPKDWEDKLKKWEEQEVKRVEQKRVVEEKRVKQEEERRVKAEAKKQ